MEKKFIQDHPQITLAGGLSFEPFIMHDDDDNVIGHDAEIAHLITQKTGLKINFELGKWSEIQKRAQRRALDGLITAVPTEERNAYYIPSKSYLYYTPLIIVKKGNPKGIYSLDDIAGKRVGFQRGNAFQYILRQEGKKTESVYFDTIHDLIKAVVSEKTDFTILDESAFYVARQLGLANMIQAPFSTGKGVNLHILLRNDWPELVTIVNKGLKAITHSEKDAIHKRWFGVQGINADKSKIQIPLTPDETTYLNKKGSVKVCIDPTWMPYEHINTKGVYEGMSADYLKLFSEQLGMSVELYPTKSWHETLNAAKSHKCDVIPFAKTSEERKSYFNFTTPYLTIPYVIATKTDEFFIEDISQALDKTFAVIRGYLIADELRKKYPGIQLVEVESNREGIQKVRNGEAFGYIGATATLAYALHRENISNIKIAGQLPLGFELGVATRKDEPLLHDLFQKAVDNLTQDEKKRIHDKWIAVNIYKIMNYTLLWTVLAVIAIILIIIGESYRRISKANQSLTLLNTELVATLAENKTLKGIIPICSYCKKIRDDEGFWDQVEYYISQHTQAEFSHSFCPDCEEKAYKDAGLAPPKD